MIAAVRPSLAIEGRFVQWNEPPLVTVNSRPEVTTYSRRDVVLNVANTDGGAHVDPKLKAHYVELSRRNAIGYTATKGGREYPLLAPQLPALRQIAHEALLTFQECVPDLMEEFPTYAKDIRPTPYGVSLETGEPGGVSVEVRLAR